MAAQTFFCSLKAIAKRIALLFAGGLMLWGLVQSPALASGTPVSQLALAGSSRFAAQAEAGPQESNISEQKLNEMREKRREWQSEASGDAAREAELEHSESFGEALQEKLNLDEIAEENEILDNSQSR